MITICQQALNDFGGSTSSTSPSSSSSSSSARSSCQFHKAMYDDPREYGSFHLRTDTSTGHNGRSSSPNAVASSSCIIPDHHHHRNSNHSSPSKPCSTSFLNDDRISSIMGEASKIKRSENNEGALKHGNDTMSGLSLAMTKNNDDDDANTNNFCPGDQIIMTANEIDPPTAALKMMDDEQYYEQEQENDTWLILPESPVTRAAFHEPPPLYPNDIHRAKLEQSPFSVNGIDGSVGDSIVVEATSSALASLIERCTEEGSPRLKIFQQRKQNNVVESSTAGGGDDRHGSKENDFPSSSEDLSSVEDRLSDFKSFGVSMSPVF